MLVIWFCPCCFYLSLDCYYHCFVGLFLFPTSSWFTLSFSFSLVYSRYPSVPVLRSLMCFVSLTVGSTLTTKNSLICKLIINILRYENKATLLDPGSDISFNRSITSFHCLKKSIKNVSYRPIHLLALMVKSFNTRSIVNF